MCFFDPKIWIFGPKSQFFVYLYILSTLNFGPISTKLCGLDNCFFFLGSLDFGNIDDQCRGLEKSG